MKRRWLRIIGWGMGILVAGVAAYFAFLIYIFARNGTPCLHRSEIIARNAAGDHVEFNEDICDGMAHSMVGSLAFFPKGQERGTIFVRYQEAKGRPVVRWSAPDALFVHVDHAEEIYFEKRAVGGVKVRYDIGNDSR